MPNSLNRVTLLGNLGQDPEIKTTSTGLMIANLRIATTENYKDKVSGEWKEITEWHRVTLWDNLAKIAYDYLRKGNKVYIEGKLKYGSYDDNTGRKIYTTDIYATTLIMLSPKDSNIDVSSSSSQNIVNNPSYSQGNDIVEQLAAHLTPDMNDEDVPF